jgi:hypothetical protein
MPVCTASDCNGETPLEGTLCADHFAEARAYYLAQYQLRLQPAFDPPRREPPAHVIFDRDFFSPYNG